MKTPFEVQLWDVHTTLDEFSLFHIPLHCMLEPIFVWTWNENARTKQKQQTNGNRAISLVYRTDTNARGLWLVYASAPVKKFYAQELSRNQSILRFDVILQHDWPVEQCFLHIRVFFGGKTKRPCFDLFIHWLINRRTLTETIFQGHRKVALSKRNNKYVYMCMCI